MTTALPRIAGYRMLGLLGEGGMGRVFLAEDQLLQRRVAVKVIAERLVGEGDARVRFLREARAMAVVEHPHVVRVYAFGEADGQAYFVMELVEGETLRSRLASRLRLPEPEARTIARQTASALQAAWSRGIVHRDVKPANILIDRDERVRVADFGLARQTTTVDETLTETGPIVAGTPDYMSPEQARGGDVDFRSDIYSLGVVLYEMVGGRRPFTGRTPMEVIAKHLTEPLPPLRQACADVSPTLSQLVTRMTAKRREERPDSYADLMRALSLEPSFGGESPSLAGTSLSTTKPAAARPRVPRRHRMWLAGACVVVLFLAAAGWYVAQTRVHHAAFAVAVTPLYGPDAESAREGRLLASLLESEIERRLPADDTDVSGVEKTERPVRSRRAARELAERLHADVVVWGDTLIFGDQLEFAPRLTRRDGSLLEPSGGSVALGDAGAVAARRQQAVAVAERVQQLYQAR